jgi:hypothetical protein
MLVALSGVNETLSYLQEDHSRDRAEADLPITLLSLNSFLLTFPLACSANHVSHSSKEKKWRQKKLISGLAMSTYQNLPINAAARAVTTGVSHRENIHERIGINHDAYNHSRPGQGC